MQTPPKMDTVTLVLLPSLFILFDILGDTANRNRMFTVKIIAGKVDEPLAPAVTKPFLDEFELYLFFCR